MSNISTTTTTTKPTTLIRGRDRLNRLIGLVDNSTNSESQQLAVDRILHILYSHQYESELTTIVHRRVILYLRSNSWDVRLTGSQLLGALVRLEPQSTIRTDCINDDSICNDFVDLQSLQMQEVLKNGQPLLSEELYIHNNHTMTTKDIIKQRRSLMEHVGLCVGGLNEMEVHAVKEAIGTEVNTILTDTNTEGTATSTTSSTSYSTTTSNTKSSACDIINNMSIRQQKVHKRQRNKEAEEDQRKRRKFGLVLSTKSEEERVDLHVVLTECRHNLLNPTWEIRHGATLGLAEMMIGLASTLTKKCNNNNDIRNHLSRFVEDCVVRCLCILSLDRFCDYANDYIVSPSQEIAGQLIAVLYHRWLNDNNKNTLLKQLYILAHHQIWETRYGACVALKYIVSMNEQSITDEKPTTTTTNNSSSSSRRRRTFQYEMIKSLLIDKDADIRNVAAESIHIIFKKSIYSSSPQQNDEWINICWKMLWEELKPKCDISSSSSSVMNAIYSILIHDNNNHQLFVTSIMLENTMFHRFLLHGMSTVSNIF